MLPNELWSEDTIFVEIGLRDDRFADSLDQAGFGNYLGVSRDSHHAERVRNARPDLAHCVTSSRRRKLVLHNNAQVLILSGRDALNAWRFRDVRHADWLVWKAGFSLLSLVTLLGCCWHMLTKRFARPRLVRFTTSDGGTHWAYAARVLRQKQCYRKALHFIPHRLGLTGFFGALEKKDVQYAVLRWFEKLPHVEPEEDVDMLVADDSLDRAIAILHSAPGIMPCDLYSETGLPLSDYCGTPYYPEDVARRVLEGAVRHNDVCMVPSQWDYFHSLCYHAVYHKGHRTNLPVGDRRVHARRKSPHDFAAILKQMADSLSLEVEISLEGLHSYLSESGWGPSPEMLARLAMACPRNPWLQVLAEQLEKSVVDQGLAVFVIRQETIDQGFDDLAVKMIEEGGFEILATHTLTPEEVEYATTRSRGGNWTCGGPFDRSGGPPAIAVVAYDHDPIPLTARQLRRFPERTNARIFIKEDIRDEIISRVPAKQGFNAMHSSDHAAEAWHLIEVLAPCLIKPTRERLEAIYRGETPAPALSRAA